MVSTPSDGPPRRSNERPGSPPTRAFLIGIALLLGPAVPAGGTAPARPGSAGDPAGLAQALERETDPEPLPAYHLRIEPKPLRRLLAYRERIHDRAALSPDDRLWIPATFIHQGEHHPVKLRIRGDLPAHWRGDRQSFRVKFRSQLLEGKKEINLILPWDKHYGVEVLQTRISEELGLPYFPGRFVHLHINGSDAGFYLESEHPTREYLERTGRPASSIFTFAFYWSLYFSKPYHVTFILPGSRDLLPLKGVAQIKQRGTYQPDRPVFAKKQLAYAIEFYRLMAEGNAEEIGSRAQRYLDLDNFAAYAALQDFFGSRHAMELNDNVRLYLDPTSGKFQFMPWDTSLRPLRARLEEPGMTLETLLTPQDEAFRALLRRVPGLRAHKDRVLRRLVERGEIYRAALNRIHARLIRLYPEDQKLRNNAASLDRELARNVEILRRYLSSRSAGAGTSGS